MKEGNILHFNLSQTLKNTQNRLFNMIKKGFVTKASKDSNKYNSVQVKYFNKLTNAAQIYPYGMNANAPVNTPCVLFNLNGHEDNQFALCYSMVNRFKDLKAGEAVFGNPASSSYIKFLENGDIEIYCKNNIIINGKAMNVNLENKFEVTASEADFHCKVNLGDSGQPIARKGDQVQVGSDIGTITGGSSNNKSN